MFNGSNFDRKSQLSGILTEPLNPRDTEHILKMPGLKVSMIFSLRNILIKLTNK